MEPGYVPQYLYPTVVARATALPRESQMNYKMLLQFLLGKPLIKKLTVNKYLLEQLQNTLLTKSPQPVSRLWNRGFLMIPN